MNSTVFVPALSKTVLRQVLTGLSPSCSLRSFFVSGSRPVSSHTRATSSTSPSASAGTSQRQTILFSRHDGIAQTSSTNAGERMQSSAGE